MEFEAKRYLQGVNEKANERIRKDLDVKDMKYINIEKILSDFTTFFYEMKYSTYNEIMNEFCDDYLDNLFEGTLVKELLEHIETEFLEMFYSKILLDCDKGTLTLSKCMSLLSDIYQDDMTLNIFNSYL